MLVEFNELIYMTLNTIDLLKEVRELTEISLSVIIHFSLEKKHLLPNI